MLTKLSCCVFVDRGGVEVLQHAKKNKLKAYLHAAISRADLSAPRNREANRRVCFGLCGRD